MSIQINMPHTDVISILAVRDMDEMPAPVTMRGSHIKLGEGIVKMLGGLLLTSAALAAQATPSTSYYIYDESGHVIGEYDANGNPVEEHIYLGDRPVAVVQGGSTPAMSYVTTDQLNTPRVVTDANATVEWSWSSDPFGNGQPTGSLTYNLRFPGQYYDAETGHNYNYFRDYDSVTGRYIESDPIGLKGGINTYDYVLDNPVKFVDSQGTATLAIPMDITVPDWLAPELLPFLLPLTLSGDTPQQCPKHCPSCSPYPEGTIGYLGPHADNHFNKDLGRNLNPHLNLFEVNQNKSTCKCFWNKSGLDSAEPPPAPGWVNLNNGFPPLTP